MKNLHLCPFMLQYGWYFDNSKDFSGMKFWQMSSYVHLCCSMGDILIIQKSLVVWNFDKCPFNVHLCCSMGDILIIKKDFSGMKIWQLSICVHLCCSMGEMLIIQTNQKKSIFQNWKNILCTPLGYSMYTFFFNSWRCPKTYFFFNSIFYVLVVSYIYIIIIITNIACNM